MRLRYQFFAIAILPMAVVFGLLAGIFLHFSANADAAREMGKIVNVSRSLSDLVHELQRERGFSAGFIGSSGAIFEIELKAQRNDTDAAIAGAENDLQYLTSHEPEIVDRIRVSMRSLSKMRREVDQREANLPSMAAFYIGAIKELLGLVELELFEYALEGRARMFVETFIDVMLAKENAGLERAMGAVGFGSGQFPPEIYVRFVDHRGRQASLLDRSASAHEGPFRDEYERLRNGAALQAVDDLRRQADAGVFDGGAPSATGPVWFARSTAWIDSLREMELLAAENALIAAEQMIEEARSTMTGFSVAAVILMAACLALPAFIAFRVEGGVARVLAAMRLISEDRLDAPPPEMTGGGEIAEFARMARVFHANALRRDAAVTSAEEAMTAKEQAEAAMEEARLAREAEREAAEARAAAEDDRKRAEDAARRDAQEREAKERAAEQRRSDEEAKAQAARLAEIAEREKEREFAAAALSSVVDELGGALRRMAAGDLTCVIDRRFEPEYEALRTDYNEAVETLCRTIAGVVEHGGDLKRIAAEVSGASGSLARRTEAQAATLDQNADALSSLNDLATDSAADAKRLRQTADAAKEKVDASQGVMGEAVAAMDMIERSSEKISSIIAVIEDISFQTNLLALNAGVEAARAGEAGRGFAVVASEVRGLALRASDASQEIKNLIADSAAQTCDGVGLVKRTGETLREVASRFDEINGAVAGFADRAAEQLEQVDGANSGVRSLNDSTRQNAAMSEETTAVAGELSGKVDEFFKDLAIFRTEPEAKCSSAAA